MIKEIDKRNYKARHGGTWVKVSTEEAGTEDHHEVKASLGYIMS